MRCRFKYIHIGNTFISCYCPASSTWSQRETQGRHPAARHGHVIVAIGFKIYIHGGMAAGKFYNDVYSLDTSKISQITIAVSHFNCSSRNKSLIMRLITIISSCLFSGNMKWEKLHAKGDIPPGVAAHSAVSLGNNIYIFGGMTAGGAINSMYRFNTGTRITSYSWGCRKKTLVWPA